LKIVTINIPDQYLDCIQSMVELGFFPSRSEAVRVALKQFLVRESEINDGFEHENFKQIKVKQVEALIH
jgi:Arc/MetJ-type ribon-helix-helix transcriptional regulator